MGKEATPRQTRPKKTPVERIIAASMELAAEKGWQNVNLAEVASSAKLPFSDVYQHCPSKAGILDALARQTDAIVLDGVTGVSDESAHDQLFDILMRRFDALSPYKDGVRAVLRNAPRDPLSTLCSGPQLIRSFSWMLTAAGISTRGLRGLARTKSLILVWLTTMRTWLNDDDPDLGKTMAALDRNLKRAETWCGLTGRRPAPEAPAAEAAA